MKFWPSFLYVWYSIFGEKVTVYCDVPDCVDLNYEGIVWACAESHIKKVLSQFGLYKQLGEAPTVTGNFGVYHGYG